MTAEPDLLPLPEWAACDETVADMSTTDVREAMNDYARANVAHATAPLQADIEELRAKVDRYQKRWAENEPAATYKQRAERLAETLRLAEEHINDLTPEWYSAGNGVLAEIRAALAQEEGRE